MLQLLSFDSVHINGPYRPGGPFFEDRSPTTVGYYAKDSSGNMATCNSRSVGPVNVNAIKRKQLKHNISIDSV
jgi:hypothetical protein